MSSELRDNIQTRGVYKTSILGTGTFIGLRSLDVFLQHAILSNGSTILSKLNISTFPSSNKPIAFGLPLKPLLLLCLAAGSTLKQVFWALAVAQEEVPVGSAVGISIFNSVFNSVNSLLSFTFLSASSWSLLVSKNEDKLDKVAVIGLGLYIGGILIETVSEVQRKIFKNDPKNKGKVFTGGLFGSARHINYGAYTAWRTGYATIAGGPMLGAVVALFFGVDFAGRGIPVLDEYCSKRYGAQWEQYKQQTPSKLWPGIY